MQYISKNNDVVIAELNGTKVIKKTFKDKKQFCKELQFYVNHSAIVGIPKLLHSEVVGVTNVIYKEFICGELLIDSLTRHEAAFDIEGLVEDIGKAITFLSMFNKATGMQVGDCNFRNFILTPQTAYFVDLENCGLGDSLQDVAQLLAFLLTYDKIFTDYKVKVLAAILPTLIQYDSEILLQNIVNQVEFLGRRRGADFSKQLKKLDC